MEGGGWRVKGGEWRVEGGEWRVEGGRWRVEGLGYRISGRGNLSNQPVHQELDRRFLRTNVPEEREFFIDNLLVRIHRCVW